MQLSAQLSFLFLTILPVLLGHLPHLTSNKFLTLLFILWFSLFLRSCPNYMELLPKSVLPIYSTVFNAILKHTFSKQLLILPSNKLQCLQFIYVTNGTL